ncbi:MAG: glycosyltransferase family 4 protein [Chloroflexota bacterium]
MSPSTNKRILMLLENNPYSEDIRVKHEATALDEAGYTLSIICPRPKNGKFYEEISDGISLFQYPAPIEGEGLLAYIWEYGYSVTVMFFLSLWVALWKGFDVVHTHNPPDFMFVIGGFYKLFGKQFVFDHHDLAPENYMARFDSDSSKLVHRFLISCEKLTAKMADHLIVTNESYKEMNQIRSDISPDRITIVRNGPDEERIHPVEPDPELRAQAGTLLGYVGIMGPQDGIEYLLRSIQILVHELKQTDIYCILIGKSNQLAHYRSMVNELAINDHICFTGWISDEELVRILSTVDICLVPDPSNPFNDRCTMIKIMEYMALGKPIVAFDLPEHRYSAQDAALYARNNNEAEFAAHINTLILHPKMRRAMSRAGKRRVRNVLAWHHQKNNLIAAYEQLLYIKHQKPIGEPQSS